MNEVVKVNNVEIVLTGKGNRLVAIKPICDALGVDYKSQYDKLKDDEDFNSVMGLSTTTGADGKQYEMVCMDIRFIFGWLFTINPKNVKEDVRDHVRKFRMECVNVLADHFIDSPEYLEHKNRLMNEAVAMETQARSEYKDAEKRIKEAKAKYQEAIAFTKDDWEKSREQLELDFSEN